MLLYEPLPVFQCCVLERLGFLDFLAFEVADPLEVQSLVADEIGYREANHPILVSGQLRHEFAETGIGPGSKQSVRFGPPVRDVRRRVEAEFVPIGVVGRANDGGPALLARMPAADDRIQGGVRPEGECRRATGLEARAGVIEIDLLEGARVRVDAFVDARALARVLSALKRHA
jgi:hypothetical protein